MNDDGVMMGNVCYMSNFIIIIIIMKKGYCVKNHIVEMNTTI